MPRTATNLMGHTFERLTVLDRAESNAVGAARWHVRCVCGVEKIVRSSTLTAGMSKSCGCLAKELAAQRFRTHGLTGTFEHNVWLAMKKRCNDPRHPRYARYGGRGIKICARWQKFENFFADMGNCPFEKGSIERTNNDKGYSPGNCVWLLKSHQSRNRNCVKQRN